MVSFPQLFHTLIVTVIRSIISSIPWIYIYIYMCVLCMCVYISYILHTYLYVYIYICKCMCMCMMYVCFFIDSLSLAVQGRWRVVDLNDPKPWAPWSGDPNGGAWGRFTSLFYVMYINIYIYIHCLCMCVNIDMYRYIYRERESDVLTIAATVWVANWPRPAAKRLEGLGTEIVSVQAGGLGSSARFCATKM